MAHDSPGGCRVWASPAPPALSLGLLLAWVVGCGATGTGCPALAPLPDGGFHGAKAGNHLNLRISPDGLAFVNAHWPALLDDFAPGRELRLAVPCSVTRLGVVGEVALADQGSAGCTSETCGQMDGVCDGRDVPKEVVVRIADLALLAKPPNGLEVVLQVEIQTGELFVDTVSRRYVPCLSLPPLFGWPAKCSLSVNSADPQDPANATNRLKASVNFTLDQRWDGLTAFEVSAVDGTEVCGSGAPGKPDCLDPADVDIDGRNACGNVYCGILDWAPIKSMLLRLMAPMLRSQVQRAVASNTCRRCGPGLPACPNLPNGCSGAACVSTSFCDAPIGTCVDSATSRCVPRFFGVEGRLAIGGVLGGGGSVEGALDLSAALGATAVVDTGITLGTRAGVEAPALSSCVPPAAEEPLIDAVAPIFDAEATPGSTYHVAVSASAALLNRALHQAHQSGALCIQLSAADSPLLTSGLVLFKLSSLPTVVDRDGKNAPMMVVIRPALPPTVKVGSGSSLIRFAVKDLSVDFYAMVDDRFARLLTVTVDLSLPLSFVVEGCGTVTPVLGDLPKSVTNVRVSRSEILPEDPAMFAALVPEVIRFLEPAVAQGLGPLTLPSLGAFKVKVKEAKGVARIGQTDEYQQLALYSQLVAAGGSCAVVAPRTTASLKHVVPHSSPLADPAWPTATVELAVQAISQGGTPEFATRVDHGLWTEFRRPQNGDALVVSHPALLLEGAHTIEVRSRVAEEPAGISAPAALQVVVDTAPPAVSFVVNEADDQVDVTAHDGVSSGDSLRFSYAFGDGAFSDFGPRRPLSLSAAENQGGVSVRVKDQRGNVTEARWPPQDRHGRSPDQDRVEAPVSYSGCRVGGGALGPLGIVWAAWWWRRGARRRLFSL